MRTIAAVALAGLGGLVLGCGTSSNKTPDTGGASMQGGEGAGGNVPPPPNVDRSKCDKSGKQVVTSDTNGDRKPDVWKFFAPVQQGGQTVQVQTCRLVDLNHDGRTDIIVSFDDKGRQEKEELDLDWDGKFDLVAYYQNGKRVREELDMNLDQKPEVWKYYENDKIVRAERDRNNDGRVDEWQYYEAGRLDRVGYDSTGAGKVDRWDRSPESDDEAPLAAAAPPASTPPPAAPEPAPAPTEPAKKPDSKAESKKAAKKK